MGRTQYHVVPRDNGKWAVKKEGSMRASSTHRKKSAAKAKAQRLCKDNKPSELIIHDIHGMISRKHSYGKDPFPPRG